MTRPVFGGGTIKTKDHNDYVQSASLTAICSRSPGTWYAYHVDSGQPAGFKNARAICTRLRERVGKEDKLGLNNLELYLHSPVQFWLLSSPPITSSKIRSQKCRWMTPIAMGELCSFLAGQTTFLNELYGTHLPLYVVISIVSRRSLIKGEPSL